MAETDHEVKQAKEYLELEKKEHPVEYMSRIKKKNREESQKLAELKSQTTSLQNDINEKTNEKNSTQKKLDSIQENIVSLEKQVHYLEGKKNQDTVALQLVDNNLKANLFQYVSIEKYGVIKNIFSKFKTKQKKTQNLEACIVYYFIEDFFENNQNEVKVPYIVKLG